MNTNTRSENISHLMVALDEFMSAGMYEKKVRPTKQVKTPAFSYNHCVLNILIEVISSRNRELSKEKKVLFHQDLSYSPCEGFVSLLVKTTLLHPSSNEYIISEICRNVPISDPIKNVLMTLTYLRRISLCMAYNIPGVSDQENLEVLLGRKAAINAVSLNENEMNFLQQLTMIENEEEFTKKMTITANNKSLYPQYDLLKKESTKIFKRKFR